MANQWSNSLSSSFLDLLDNTMKVPKLQEIYDQTPITTTDQVGRVESAATAAQLSALLNDKDGSLRIFAKQAFSSDSTKDLLIGAAKSITSGLTEKKDDQIMRIYFASHKDGSIVLHSVDGRTDPKEAAPTSSTRDYTPIDPKDLHSNFEVPDHTVTDTYDVRRTGWYANAVAGPKDVFIIIDETGLDTKAFKLLKETLHYILETISPNDNIWIQRKVQMKTNSTLTPLDDTNCMQGHSRGKREVVKKLITLTNAMTLSSKLENTKMSSPSEWISMFDKTLSDVDIVRSKLLNKERAGVVIILSSGNIDAKEIQDQIIPFVLKKNIHTLPIIGFNFETASLSTSSSSSAPLIYSCNNLGSSSWVSGTQSAQNAALYYEHIINIPKYDDPLTSPAPSSLHFWNGLFSHIPSVWDFGSSNKANIMTMTRAIYRYEQPDKSKRTTDEKPILVGVVAFDMNLRTLKDVLDAASENLGRTSFPILVTPHGDTIYHPLMNEYKKRDLIDINTDISNFEYFKHIDEDNHCSCQHEWVYMGETFTGCDETPDWIGTTWCYVANNNCEAAQASFIAEETRKWLECDASNDKSFDTVVRPPLLRGELGEQQLRVNRALPAGDAATEGFEGRIIDTTYFYTRVIGWDLRLSLVIDAFDLKKTSYIPKESPRIITSQIQDYMANERNMKLAKLVPNIKFINNDNCKAEGSDVLFSNCKPDEYCARVQASQPHPMGVVPNQPPCVDGSTCECEKHRWPVGLIGLNAACIHVAPKSLIVPQNQYDLSSGVADVDLVNLTYELTSFLNRDPNSENPREQKLRSDAIEHALSASPITSDWVNDQAKGVHNDTVWLYYGTTTGMAFIFPPNYWGFLYDPTRRPWYGRAISSGTQVRAAISTPYLDSGGAGLMNTLTSVVWGPRSNTNERKINGVVGFDFLYPVMNNMLPEMTDCSSKAVRDIGQSGTREISCWLFELSGLFLSHSDFLASKEDKEKFGQGGGTDVADAGEWPIENVFVGKKEPDLADALINANVFEKLTSRTPDSKRIVHYYRVNENLFTEENPVISGKINIADSKCLQAPSDSGDVTWFVAHVKESNAYILVVDGYRRKDSECTFKTTSKPTEIRDTTTQSCNKPKLFQGEISSWQKVSHFCTRCRAGEYSSYPFTPCLKCPPGTYSKFDGSASCNNCSIGEYNEVDGQSECRVCQRGQYSLELGASKNSCQQCPEGGVCAGGSKFEASVIMSTPQPGSKKNIFVSYWRDPLILKNTGRASTCFYQCVEPRSCLGTLSCSDDEKGVGNTCKHWRAILMSHLPSINGSTTVSFDETQTKNQNWNDEIKRYQNYSEIIDGNKQCSEISSVGEQYCVVARFNEGCAIGYRGDTCAGCDVGFAHSGKTGTQCSKCQPQSIVIPLVVTGTIFGFVIYAFLIMSTLTDYGDLSREGIVARVISSNILILSLIKDLEIQFPDVLRSFMGAGSVAGDPVSLLNLECLFQESNENTNVIPYIILKALITLVVPILFAIILGIIFGCQSLRAKNVSEKKKSKRKIADNRDGNFNGDMFTGTLAVAMAKRFATKNDEGDKNNAKDDSDEKFGGALMTMDSIVDEKVMFKASIVVSVFLFVIILFSPTVSSQVSLKRWFSS